MNGALIVFEGFEGCGKTTTLDVIVNAMSATGIPVRRARCPGHTPLGEFTRSCMHGGVALSEAAESPLFAAAWADLCHQEIIPALAAGEFVFLDRAQPVSMIFYQVLARKDLPDLKLPTHVLDTMIELSKYVRGMSGSAWPPEVLIHMHASAKVSFERASKKRDTDKDRMEDIPGIFEKGAACYQLCVDLAVNGQSCNVVNIDTEVHDRHESLLLAWEAIRKTLEVRGMQAEAGAVYEVLKLYGFCDA